MFLKIIMKCRSENCGTNLNKSKKHLDFFVKFEIVLFHYFLNTIRSVVSKFELKQAILYYKIQSVCVSVCLFVSMLVRNRLPNHANYGDGTFTGDSVGLG